MNRKLYWKRQQNDGIFEGEMGELSFQLISARSLNCNVN